MKANRIKLSPEKITTWWQMLRAFLIARVPELKIVLSDDAAAWEVQHAADLEKNRHRAAR